MMLRKHGPKPIYCLGHVFLSPPPPPKKKNSTLSHSSLLLICSPGENPHGKKKNMGFPNLSRQLLEIHLVRSDYVTAPGRFFVSKRSSGLISYFIRISWVSLERVFWANVCTESCCFETSVGKSMKSKETNG